MENLIIYGIVAIVVIVNIVRNYQKEAKKNKERVLGTPQSRPVPSYNQESNQSKPSQAPFSRPRKTEVEKPYNDISTETISTPTVSDSLNKYQAITSMGYNYTQEGTSSITHEYDEKKNEQKAFTQDVNDKNIIAQDLQLETSEDLQRAFIHSIILERKY